MMLVLIIIVPLYIIATLLFGASITAGIFVVHVAIAALLFKYSKTFRRRLVFSNFVQWPINVDYDDPAASGIKGGRNVTIDYYSKIDLCPIKIGIWHILPMSSYEKHKDLFKPDVDKYVLDETLESELANSKLPIMFYCHGNSNTRAAAHRIMLYNFFQKMDFHTIAFDYRGYGDSTNVSPTEDGVVEDALYVYDWVHTMIEKGDAKPPVFIWGHSLGTGISSHLVGDLKRMSILLLERRDYLPLPKGLILEAPFNNMADEVKFHPLANLVNWLPYFESCFVEPFELSREYGFKSDYFLTQLPQLPVLILHAEDDLIVPYCVGQRLYIAIKAFRKSGDAPVILQEFDRDDGYGHRNICKADKLPEYVGNFVTRHR